MTKRAVSHTTTNSVNERVVTPKKSVSADSSPVKVAKRPKRAGKEGSAKALTDSATLNGDSNVTKTPRKALVAGSDAQRAVSGPARINGQSNDAASDTAISNHKNETAATRPVPAPKGTQVNSIVRQINGDGDRDALDKRTNGTAQDGFVVRRAGAPSEAGTTAKSVADTTDAGSSEGLAERRQPVKLKRKVPG